MEKLANIIKKTVFSLVLVALPRAWDVTPASAQVTFGEITQEQEGTDAGDEEARGVTYGVPQITKYRAGIIFQAQANSPCNSIVATCPVPMEFPEQKVRILEEEFPQRLSAKYRDLKEGGARQLVVKMSTLRPGQRMEVFTIFEVTRLPAIAPAKTDCYHIPSRTPREFRAYLRDNSFIESGSRNITRLAKELTEEKANDWQKVEALFSYIRKNVTYKEALAEAPMRGALAALKNKEGDCEDMCALFIAMCRALDIPARLVRLPGHCYAEFFLEDDKGDGHWFPAQVAGMEPLGNMQDTRIILQKGDCFHLPEEPKSESLYVKEIFTGKVSPGGKDPKYQFINEVML
ncbi:MAG: transglutaminase-like domain-containing protein [Planctomycetia bacterium]|nr:transglutaminase-like domain-containing protein [Planctomycetia bacterium]